MNAGSASAREQVRRVEEAAEWFLRLREEDIDEEALAAWFAWCGDADNLREFEALASVWRGAGQLTAVPRAETRVTRSWAASFVDSLPGVFGRRSVWAGAVVVTLCVVIGYQIPWSAFGGKRRSYAAQTAIRSSDLTDGSNLTVAPRTAVTVDFTGQTRRLTMASGEAFFRVHADQSKPFVVTLDDIRVTALGTAFDVQVSNDRVVVTVEEGLVEVGKSGAPTAGPWRIGGGYQLTYDRGAATPAIARVPVEQVISWRTGRLEYVGQTLGAVVAEVSRYSSRAIEIGDPQLSRLIFTGTVHTEAIDDWLEGVQATFPIRVVVAQDGHYVLLNRRSDPAN